MSHLEIALEKDALTVRGLLDRGDREIVACNLPAVITVDEGSAEVPYASLPQVLASERIEIPVMDLAAIGLKASDIRPNCSGRFLHYVPPRPRTKKVPMPDPSLNPLQIITGGAAKKSSSLVEGEPKKAAAEIVRFLISNGVLSP